MRAAIFIDRDGTLNEEVEYLSRPEDAVLTPGAAAALARVNAQGIPVVVVTNQAGIAKGKYDWEAYEAVAARIDALLKAEGARVDATYVCPFHEDGIGDFRVEDHPDRKPNPGMLLRASQDLALDLERSWMVGDKPIDLEAGRRAGCRTALVLTGYGADTDPASADLVADNLAQALEAILTRWMA